MTTAHCRCAGAFLLAVRLTVALELVKSAEQSTASPEQCSPDAFFFFPYFHMATQKQMRSCHKCAPRTATKGSTFTSVYMRIIFESRLEHTRSCL